MRMRMTSLKYFEVKYKCLEPESYRNREYSSGAYDHGKEDGKPTIQAHGGVKFNSADAAAVKSSKFIEFKIVKAKNSRIQSC